MLPLCNESFSEDVVDCLSSLLQMRRERKSISRLNAFLHSKIPGFLGTKGLRDCGIAASSSFAFLPSQDDQEAAEFADFIEEDDFAAANDCLEVLRQLSVKSSEKDALNDENSFISHTQNGEFADYIYSAEKAGNSVFKMSISLLRCLSKLLDGEKHAFTSEKPAKSGKVEYSEGRSGGLLALAKNIDAIRGLKSEVDSSAMRELETPPIGHTHTSATQNFGCEDGSSITPSSYRDALRAQRVSDDQTKLFASLRGFTILLKLLMPLVEASLGCFSEVVSFSVRETMARTFPHGAGDGQFSFFLHTPKLYASPQGALSNSENAAPQHAKISLLRALRCELLRCLSLALEVAHTSPSKAAALYRFSKHHHEEAHARASLSLADSVRKKVLENLMIAIFCFNKVYSRRGDEADDGDRLHHAGDLQWKANLQANGNLQTPHLQSNSHTPASREDTIFSQQNDSSSETLHPHTPHSHASENSATHLGEGMVFLPCRATVELLVRACLKGRFKSVCALGKLAILELLSCYDEHESSSSSRSSLEALILKEIVPSQAAGRKLSRGGRDIAAVSVTHDDTACVQNSERYILLAFLLDFLTYRARQAALKIVLSACIASPEDSHQSLTSMLLEKLLKVLKTSLSMKERRLEPLSSTSSRSFPSSSSRSFASSSSFPFSSPSSSYPVISAKTAFWMLCRLFNVDPKGRFRGEDTKATANLSTCLLADRMIACSLFNEEANVVIGCLKLVCACFSLFCSDLESNEAADPFSVKFECLTAFFTLSERLLEEETGKVSEEAFLALSHVMKLISGLGLPGLKPAAELISSLNRLKSLWRFKLIEDLFESFKALKEDFMLEATTKISSSPSSYVFEDEAGRYPPSRTNLHDEFVGLNFDSTLASCVREVVESLVSLNVSVHLQHQAAIHEEQAEGYGNRPLREQVESCFIKAVEAFGSDRIVTEFLPVDLLAVDLDDPLHIAKSNVWALPLLKKGIKKTKLMFFNTYFYPMSKQLYERSVYCQSNDREKEARLCNRYFLQIYSLLPSFFDDPLDLSEAVAYDDYSLRNIMLKLLAHVDVCEYVCQAITSVCKRATASSLQLLKQTHTEEAQNPLGLSLSTHTEEAQLSLERKLRGMLAKMEGAKDFGVEGGDSISWLRENSSLLFGMVCSMYLQLETFRLKCMERPEGFKGAESSFQSFDGFIGEDASSRCLLYLSECISAYAPFSDTTSMHQNISLLKDVLNSVKFDSEAMKATLSSSAVPKAIMRCIELFLPHLDDATVIEFTLGFEKILKTSHDALLAIKTSNKKKPITVTGESENGEAKAASCVRVCFTDIQAQAYKGFRDCLEVLQQRALKMEGGSGFERLFCVLVERWSLRSDSAELEVKPLWFSLLGLRSTSSRSTVKGRLACISSLLKLSINMSKISGDFSPPKVGEEKPVGFALQTEVFPALLPEILINLVDINKNLRESAAQTLVCMSKFSSELDLAYFIKNILTFIDVRRPSKETAEEASSAKPLLKLNKEILLRAAACTALSLVVKEHSDFIQPRLVSKILYVVSRALRESNLVTFKSALKFIKTALKFLPVETFDAPTTGALLKALNSPHAAKGKMMIRRIVEKLTKRLDESTLVSVFPTEHKRLLLHVKRLSRRRRSAILKEVARRSAERKSAALSLKKMKGKLPKRNEISRKDLSSIRAKILHTQADVLRGVNDESSSDEDDGGNASSSRRVPHRSISDDPFDLSDDSDGFEDDEMEEGMALKSPGLNGSMAASGGPDATLKRAGLTASSNPLISSFLSKQMSSFEAENESFRRNRDWKQIMKKMKMKPEKSNFSSAYPKNRSNFPKSFSEESSGMKASDAGLAANGSSSFTNESSRQLGIEWSEEKGSKPLIIHSDDSEDEVRSGGSKKNPLSSMNMKAPLGLKKAKFVKRGPLKMAIRELKAKKTRKNTSGHYVVKSKAEFSSRKARGDMKKNNNVSPYAYIKLNPAMLRKNNRKKALKSFKGL